MTNAVRDGDIATALTCLNKLLHAGEAPQKILGGLVYIFKKFAVVTELTRQKMGMKDALKEAGVFFREYDQAERYLKRLGRARRTSCLVAWLRRIAI